jgi:hypothetical protein
MAEGFRTGPFKKYNIMAEGFITVPSKIWHNGGRV